MFASVTFGDAASKVARGYAGAEPGEGQLGRDEARAKDLCVNSDGGPKSLDLSFSSDAGLELVAREAALPAGGGRGDTEVISLRALPAAAGI